MGSNKDLPDFEDMTRAIYQIVEYKKELGLLKLNIESLEAEVIRKVTTDPAFFRDGKVLSMNLIESTYKHTGISGELIPLREQEVTLGAMLKKWELTFEMYKMMIDVWKTEVYQQRITAL